MDCRFPGFWRFLLWLFPFSWIFLGFPAFLPFYAQDQSQSPSYSSHSLRFISLRLQPTSSSSSFFFHFSQLLFRFAPHLARVRHPLLSLCHLSVVPPSLPVSVQSPHPLHLPHCCDLEASNLIRKSTIFYIYHARKRQVREIKC
jgi:hypothetical protein